MGRADHMSRITTGEEPIGVYDDLPDATLFKIEIAPQWSKAIISFLTTASLNDLDKDMGDKVEFLNYCSRFQLLSGRLYHLGQDGILRLVPNHEECSPIMIETHISFTGQHLSRQVTIRKVLCSGY